MFTAGLGRLFDRPLYTWCILRCTCFEQESRCRGGGYTDIPDFLPIILDALKIKLFRFEVWTNRYAAAIFVDANDGTDLTPCSVYNTWRPLNQSEITGCVANLAHLVTEEPSHHCLMIGFPSVHKSFVLRNIAFATHLVMNHTPVRFGLFVPSSDFVVPEELIMCSETSCAGTVTKWLQIRHQKNFQDVLSYGMLISKNFFRVHVCLHFSQSYCQLQVRATVVKHVYTEQYIN